MAAALWSSRLRVSGTTRVLAPFCRALVQKPVKRCRSSRSTSVACRAQQDVLLRSLSSEGEVAVLVVNGTQMVAEAARRHQTSPTATAALGRTLIGALLMGCFRKHDEQVQINFKGDGPLGGIMVMADTRANVRGKVGTPQCDPPLTPGGKLNVAAAVGAGVLSVVRSHPLEPQPYTGMVPIQTGEIAEDLATYLAESEQTNSALALGVSINKDLSVRSAGGFLVQILPFCSDETIDQLEKNLTSLPSMTELLNSGATPLDITERILSGLGVSPAPQTMLPRYGPCEPEALKQRMMRAVASLGADEVRSIMQEQGKVEVKCEMCNDTYVFQEEEILALVQS
eukprot:jgi/Chrzof1/8909/Cz03g28230.t1